MSHLRNVFRFPLLTGGVLTTLFYVVLPYCPGYEAALKELFCSHPIAYTTTILFWVGLSAIVQKALRLMDENIALRFQVPASEWEESPEDAAGRLLKLVQKVPANLRETHAIKRLGELGRHVLGQRSAEGAGGHLEYLAGFHGEQLHNSYSFIRTVTWAVPILGFLGTVIGITEAIQHLDPAKLESSFNVVVGHLGVAFGTTAQALILSLVMVFCAWLVENAERSILARVEVLGIETATTLFPPVRVESPLVAAELDVSRRLIEHTEQLMRRQVEQWSEALAEMQVRWCDTIRRQQQQLDETLKQTISESVTDHQATLAIMRARVLDGLDGVAEQWKSAADDWKSQLVMFGDVSTAQVKAQQVAATALAAIVQDQHQIVEKLHALTPTESFEETLHTLSAAVHLLSARTGTRAA